VTDTPPEVMRRYRAMLLARSPEERLSEGHPAYDFGWMWQELGLERPWEAGGRA